jgi:hypothetical protein
MLHRLLLLPLFLTTAAWACLNTPGTDLDGHDAGLHYGFDAQQLRHHAEMSSPKEAQPRSGKPPTTPAKRLAVMTKGIRVSFAATSGCFEIARIPSWALWVVLAAPNFNGLVPKKA